MKQSQAEHTLKEAIELSGIKQMYNTASEHREAKSVLLNMLHRQTSIPKYQIVNYLNNKKGFNYDTSRTENDSK
jgi:hypothetical protein